MNPTTGTHVPTSQGHAVIESRFIHFGCWNNTNDKKGTTIGKLKEVMEHLVAFIENPGEQSIYKYKPNFVIVAGDNYYPNKETTGEKEKEIKIKTIYKNKLIEGFKLLPDNIEVNMILGNHDLETNGKKPSLNVAPEIDEGVNIQEGVGECFILKTEIDAVKTSGDKKI